MTTTHTEPLVVTLRHGTVGRLTDRVSMGVVEIGPPGEAIVQFLDGGRPVSLVVGQPVRHAGLTVTLLSATPEADLRRSHLVVEFAADEEPA